MAQWWRKKTAKWKGNFCSNRLQREEWSTSKNRPFPPGNFGFILAPFTFQPFAPKISAKWKVPVSPLPPPPNPKVVQIGCVVGTQNGKGRGKLNARANRGESAEREGRKRETKRSFPAPPHSPRILFPPRSFLVGHTSSNQVS